MERKALRVIKVVQEKTGPKVQMVNGVVMELTVFKGLLAQKDQLVLRALLVLRAHRVLPVQTDPLELMESVVLRDLPVQTDPLVRKV